jgi:hypothetical protein
MRPQLTRITRYARYVNPSFTSARLFSGTRPTSPKTTSHGADHSAESYVKEVDSSPPTDSSTYQVDDTSDKVQRPHKPPTGKYSQAGVGTEEYRKVDKHEPYAPPSEGEAGTKLRYGGKKSSALEKGGKASRPDAGRG